MTAIYLGGPEGVELDLETAKQNPIRNYQGTEISSQQLRQFGEFEDDYGGETERRAGPSPRYNCHGLAFASRRTRVEGTETVNQILDDDGYVEVDEEDVMPGDLLLYFSDSGTLQHAAIVVDPPSETSLSVPRVYGKWGNWAEVIHWAHHCPYNYANRSFYRVSQ